MKNYATATVEGFVIREPVTKTTKTGKSVCSFSLAVNHFTKDGSEPGVSYIDVETWEKLAEACSQKIAKGKRVIVIGGLRQDRWEGGDGKTHAKIKLVGSEVRFIEQPLQSSLKEAV